jgi:hypothetical protein
MPRDIVIEPEAVMCRDVRVGGGVPHTSKKYISVSLSLSSFPVLFDKVIYNLALACICSRVGQIFLIGIFQTQQTERGSKGFS